MVKVPINWFVEQLIAAWKRKDGYIMCSVGQNPKKLSEWYFSGQYSGKNLTKANYWREHAERVWDCQGLADGLVTEYTGIKVNVKARDNYATWCVDKGTGVIPPEKRRPGMAVFKQGKYSYIHHIGYLVEPVDPNKPNGDYYIVEAKGVQYGVVRTKLSDGGWDRWGCMSNYFDYDSVSTGIEVKPETGSVEVVNRPTLSRKDGGEEVKLLQTALLNWNPDCLPKYGADADFGSETEKAVKAFQKAKNLEADGVVGKKTWAALEEYITPEAEMSIVVSGSTVNVRKGAGTEYDKVGTVHRGDVLTFTETAMVGITVWYHIENGWISGMYASVTK